MGVARNGGRNVLDRSARRPQGRRRKQMRRRRIMKAPIADVRPSNFWLCLIAALLAAGIAVVLLEPFQAAKGNTAVVTYTRGVLHVTIPYHAVHSGDGK